MGTQENSTQGENKKAVLLVVGEFAAVFLLLAGILFAFNYFGILSLSKISPTFFGWMPVSKKLSTFKFPGEKAEISNPSQVKKGQDLSRVNGIAPSGEKQQSNIVGIIETGDLGDDYRLVLKNKEELLKLLDSWKFFGTSFYGENSEYPNAKPLKKLVVSYISAPQKSISIKDSVTYSVAIKEDTMNFYVNLTPVVLTNPKNDAARKGDFALFVLTSVLYRATHQNEDTAVQSANIEKLFKEISSKEIFEIIGK